MSSRGDVAHAGTRRTPALLALAVGAALAWVFVVFGPTGMGAGLVVFVAAWTAMMAAMMLPSAAPFVLLYARGARPGQVAALTAGYLGMWAATGVPAYFAHELLPMTIGPVVLAAAGLYQLTPLKSACLVRCRTPADFLVRRWGRRALRLGVEHGAWCVGCCWALMAVLVLAGGMGIAWVLGLTALVTLEKLSRRGAAWSRASGVALLIAAIIQGARLWSGEPMGMS